MKIYYVEDEKGLIRDHKKYLNREGFDVTVVFNDGESAYGHINDPC